MHQQMHQSKRQLEEYVRGGYTTRSFQSFTQIKLYLASVRSTYQSCTFPASQCHATVRISGTSLSPGFLWRIARAACLLSDAY